MSFSICFDIGGSRIKSGLISKGQLQQSKVITVEDNNRLLPVLESLRREIDHIFTQNNSKECLGIGLALPCIIDTKTNAVLSKYTKYKDAQEIDIEKWASENWSLPLTVHNDAKAALLGEAFYGAGIAYNDLTMLTFGTGIGSAVMINGKLLHGKDFISGNLWGHSTVSLHGNTCNCGNTGCLEAMASTWNLEQIVKKYFSAEELMNLSQLISFELIFRESAKGKSPYQKVLSHCYDAWAAAIVNIVLAYNPECIICGGGIMNHYDTIIPEIKRRMNQHGWIDESYVDLIPAQQIDYAALFGLHHTLQTMKTS